MLRLKHIFFLIAALLLPVVVYAGIDMQAHVASDDGKAAYTTYQSKQTAYYTGSYTYATMIAQTGNTLFGTINTLMGNTCLNRNSGYSYDALRNQYINVDRDLNNSSNIIGYYDGSSFEGIWDSGATWNREHTWPQSKFKGSYSKGTSIPIGYDMQSVRPASTSVNSSRGNTAYGEGSSYYDPSEISISNSNYDSKNNGSYRGDCARVILYDYVVYGQWGSYSNSLYDSKCNVDLLTQIGTNSNSVFESLDILLKWHMQDPPSLTEMVRNDGGQDYQGNRNVFIDYPELAINMLKDEISGTTYNVTYNMSETASPAYIYTTQFGFVTYITNSGGTHPISVNVTGASYTYDASLGRLTITNVTGAVTISTSSDPTIYVSPSAITLGPIATGSSTTQTLTITGSNLTSAINIAKSGSEYISVSPTTISSNYNSANPITITYNAPATAGTHTATLTISSTGAESKIVTITASCAAAKTITWKVDDDDYTAGNPTLSVGSGGNIDQLPTPPTSGLTGCTDKVFVGWSETNIGTTPQSSAPSDIFTTTDADACKNITSNKIFYAVFATATTNTSTGTATFTASDISDTPAPTGTTNTWTHTASGITLSLSAGQRYTSGTPNTFTVTKGISNYAKLTSSSNMTQVVAIVSGSNYVIGDVSSDWDMTTSGTTHTITSTGGTELYMYATSSYQIRITQLVITYSSTNTTYSDYVTLCAEPTPCTKLATPNVTAVAGDQQITLTWPTITDAVDYNVTIDSGEGYTTECLTTPSIGTITCLSGTCTCVISSLTNGLTYTTSVLAVAAQTTCNSDADEDFATPTADCQETITVISENDAQGTVAVTEL